MLDQKDLEQIGKIVAGTEERLGTALLATEERLGNVIDEKIKASEGRVIVAVGEMVEQQVLPQIGELGDKVDALGVRVGSLEGKVGSLEGKVTSLEGKFDALEGTVANLPTKDYLDRKLATPEGERTVKVRKINEKVDCVVDTLQTKGIFSKDEATHIHQKFQVFPVA